MGALHDLIARYESAFNTKDAQAMNDLFADEPVFVNFGGVLVEDKATLLRAQQHVFAPGGPLAEVRVSYAVERITPLGDGLVAVHARQRTLGAP